MEFAKDDILMLVATSGDYRFGYVLDTAEEAQDTAEKALVAARQALSETAPAMLNAQRINYRVEARIKVKA